MMTKDGNPMNKPHSRWHEKKRYFGFHYDLHGGKDDTLLGTECSEKQLIPMLKLMNPDFVQTDCKGHPGYTSWFSKTKDASVPPKMTKDALKQWRAATKKLGIPLHCHYSGIWDKAFAEKHPEWCIVQAAPKDGATGGQNFCDNASEKMCPRSPYVTEFMIPQMLELIDNYQVDGFWIDGDLWASEPCYCERCRAAWTEETGLAEPPTEETDDLWPRWWSFTLDAFNAYVTQYCDAVHAHKPGVLVCSNWLQTFANPGEPSVPTDWISGDNSWAFGMDGSRCEARFLATREKHWDIMLWSFTKVGSMGSKTQPWYTKPAEMMMQEAAVLMASGGAVQLYENPGGASPLMRSGRLLPWRQKLMGEVGRFVKARRTLCQDTETIPQIAILHSEIHVRHTTRGKNLMWHTDVSPVRAAVYAFLEKHYNVDVLDEWALFRHMEKYPAIVVPEREKLSDEMVSALKAYVQAGGKLFVSGSASFERFGATFLGAAATKGTAEKFHAPVNKESAPVYSETWQFLKTKTAKPLGFLSEAGIPEEATTHPAAIINTVGKGKVAYIPFDIFRDYGNNRNPKQRDFIANVMHKLVGKLNITVEAPSAIDVTMRQKAEKTIVHFVNRNTGLPTSPNSPVIDEIPPIGPITVTIKMAKKPSAVSMAFEKTAVQWKHTKGVLTVSIPSVHIHAALVIA